MSRVPHKASRAPYSGGGYAPYDLPVYRGGGNGAAVSYTYATWDPAATASNIELSDGDLTATRPIGSGADWASSRATIALSSGKWYWEVTIGVGQTTIFAGGVGNASASIESFFTDSVNGYGYYAGTGGKQTDSNLTAYGASYTGPDVIGVALDVDGRTVEMFKNNASQGVIDISGVTGNLYPMCALFGSGDYVIANFGATAMTYSPPTGYNAGVYTT